MPTYVSASGAIPLLQGIGLSQVLRIFEECCGTPAHQITLDPAQGHIEPHPGVILRLCAGDLEYEIDAIASIHFPAQLERFFATLAELAARGWVSFEAAGQDEPAPVFRGPSAFAIAQVKAAYCRLRLSSAQRAHQEALAELEAARPTRPTSRPH